MDKVRGVLVSYSQCLTIHLGFLVHVNGLFRLFGVQVALLCLSEVPPLQIELGLVHEHLSNTLGVILSSYLKS